MTDTSGQTAELDEFETWFASQSRGWQNEHFAPSLAMREAFNAGKRQAADRIAWLEAGLQEIAGGLSVDRPCDIARFRLNRG